jgi:hypothetical protein
MRKISISILSISLIGIIAVVSCKKSKSSTPADNLPGTWKLTKEYADYNNNGVMDANEMISDTLVSNTNVVYVFAASGTYSTSIQGVVVNNGNWKLIDNNTYMQFTDTTALGVNNFYDHVESVSSTSLEVKDTLHAASGGTTWLYFTRQ